MPVTNGDLHVVRAPRAGRSPTGKMQLRAAHEFVEQDRHDGEHSDRTQQLGRLKILSKHAGEISDADNRHIQFRQQDA